MVYLPKDVDGLAIIEPEGTRNPRIVTREKTPYFSRAKNDNRSLTKEDDPEKKFANIEIPQFSLQKQPFSSKSNANQEQNMLQLSRQLVHDTDSRSVKESIEVKSQLGGLSTSKKPRHQPEEISKSMKLTRAVSERKPKLPTINEEENQSQQGFKQLPGKSTRQGDRRAGENLKNQNDENSMTFFGNSAWKKAGHITLDHPESITSHVRAIRDPNHEHPDSKFTQLFMDDEFKKAYGTKLAVTPNKVFGVQDAASVKKGSSKS
jgi:hypothetical protein